jgi:hypothetical protein
VEVRRGGVGAELRPQHRQDRVAGHAVAGRERQQLHQIRRAPLDPRAGGYGPRVHEHVEAAQQADVELPHTRPTLSRRDCGEPARIAAGRH